MRGQATSRPPPWGSSLPRGASGFYPLANPNTQILSCEGADAIRDWTYGVSILREGRYRPLEIRCKGDDKNALCQKVAPLSRLEH